MPEFQRIPGATLEVQHPVIFGDEVQEPTGTSDSRQLGQHSVGMGDGMQDMAAHSKVKAVVREVEFEYALPLESQSRGEAGVSRSRKLQVLFNNVDSEYTCLRKEFGQP